MSDTGFLVRVQGRPGALERVLGTLRREVLDIQTMSFFPGPRGTHEILIRTDASSERANRIRPVLERLVDVREIRALAEPGPMNTRELAVVRVPPGSGPFLIGSGRLIDQHPDGDLLEITGPPEEVDRALAELAERNVLTGYHRTGEVPVPPGVPNPKGEHGQ